jgi:hypothetical protein
MDPATKTVRELEKGNLENSSEFENTSGHNVQIIREAATHNKEFHLILLICHEFIYTDFFRILYERKERL